MIMFTRLSHYQPGLSDTGHTIVGHPGSDTTHGHQSLVPAHLDNIMTSHSLLAFILCSCLPTLTKSANSLNVSDFQLDSQVFIAWLKAFFNHLFI